VIKQSAQVGWLAGGEYFVCDAGYLDVFNLMTRVNGKTHRTCCKASKICTFMVTQTKFNIRNHLLSKNAILGTGFLV